MTAPPPSPTCQRWEQGRDLRRPTGELFDPRSYAVEPIDRGDAERFVVEHHYSGSVPAGVVWLGLWRKVSFLRAELMGAVIFSVPSNDATIPKYIDVGPRDGTELGRFVLRHEVAANGESWTLARAFKLLRKLKPSVQGVMSMSDPMERRAADGSTLTPGHVGCIYQAFNGRYLGRSEARIHHFDASGWELNPRTSEKIVAGHKGGESAMERLIKMGARRPGTSEDLRAWLNEVKSGPLFKRVRHPGKHVYGWRWDWRSPEPRPRLRTPKADTDRLAWPVDATCP